MLLLFQAILPGFGNFSADFRPFYPFSVIFARPRPTADPHTLPSTVGSNPSPRGRQKWLALSDRGTHFHRNIPDSATLNEVAWRDVIMLFWFTYLLKVKVQVVIHNYLFLVEMWLCLFPATANTKAVSTSTRLSATLLLTLSALSFHVLSHM